METSPHSLIQFHGMHRDNFTIPSLFTPPTLSVRFSKAIFLYFNYIRVNILSESGHWVSDNSVCFYSSLSLLKSTYNTVTTNWTRETHQVVTLCRRYFKVWQRISILICKHKNSSNRVFTVILVAAYPRYRSVRNASQKFEIYFQIYNTTIQTWWSLDSQNNAILISRK